ncbi:MAG: hypothetical protein GY749_42045 [Desulfobacteraceae bacterium]|nr:hypothetical protein [Desulfobacteraceae bacterium]
MAYYGNHLVNSLNMPDGAAGVFGICYSVLTWSGVGKGFSLFSPRSWVKSAGKMFDDGHSTTFLIDLGRNTLTLTGISANGWDFREDDLEYVEWARASHSATTYVYYVGVDNEFLARYRQLRQTLENTHTVYAVLWPNMWGAKTNYQNCVSQSHYLMSKLNLAHFNPQVYGWWMPSLGNELEWLRSFVPTYHGNYWWRYKRFPATNTYIIPDSW